MSSIRTRAIKVDFEHKDSLVSATSGSNPSHDTFDLQEPAVYRYVVEPDSPPPIETTDEGWDWDRIALIAGSSAIGFLILLEIVLLATAK